MAIMKRKVDGAVQSHREAENHRLGTRRHCRTVDGTATEACERAGSDGASGVWRSANR